MRCENFAEKNKTQDLSCATSFDCLKRDVASILHVDLGHLQARSQVLKFSEAKYNFSGQDFCFCYMFNKIFLGTTKFGGHKYFLFNKERLFTMVRYRAIG